MGSRAGAAARKQTLLWFIVGESPTRTCVAAIEGNEADSVTAVCPPDSHREPKQEETLTGLLADLNFCRNE